MLLMFSGDVSAKVSNVYVSLFVLPFFGLFCLAVVRISRCFV